MNILLIEDDPQTVDFICTGLSREGMSVHAETDGALGLKRAMDEDFDVIIADRMLPSLNGMQIIRELRQRNHQTPVLILSALGAVEDRVSGLRAGGDDYLAKPFALAELHARIESLVRRKQISDTATLLRIADLKMNLQSRKVTRAEQKIHLQPREFQLLAYLIKHKNQVVTRTMLLQSVWDYHFDPQTNVIDVHISRLRSKIDRNFSKPLLHTIRSVGYMLSDSQDHALD